MGFFRKVLGLRLVERTVRFDTPEKIDHLSDGDEVGTAGSIAIFFPIDDMPEESVGKGRLGAAGLMIPDGSVDYWIDRPSDHDVEHAVENRSGEIAIGFTDPDGTPFELVTGASDIEAWDGGDVPAERGIRGLRGVTVRSNDPAGTFRALGTMDWTRVGRHDEPRAGDRVRFQAPDDRTGAEFVGNLRVPDRLDAGVEYIEERVPDITVDQRDRADRAFRFVRHRSDGISTRTFGTRLVRTNASIASRACSGASA
ncbi:hypothetical protein ACNS7O_17615 (plasmid) [Haloferacaceae archaeon DSL9]